MFAAQGGKCKCCGVALELKSRKTHVDHCHATGKVRGILCHYCNVGLGVFEDSPDRLKLAIKYLRKTA